MEREQPDTRGRIEFLDILRGVAPLLVLWAHLGGWWLHDRQIESPLQEYWTDKIAAPLHLWQNGGYLGVLIFFLISGFIVSHVAQRESRSEFMLKRCARILPLYWGVLALIGLLAPLTVWLELPMVLGPQAEEFDFLATATFASWARGTPAVFSIGWTLFIELQFYAVLWLLIPLARRNPLAGSWAALALSMAAYMYAFRQPGWIHFLWNWMYLPYLLVGRAFYLHWANLASPAQALVFGSSAFGAFLLMFVGIADGRLLAGGVEALVSQLIAIAAFGALCFSTVRCIPPLAFCANVSYSLYLLHAPVGSFLLDLLTGRAGWPYELALAVTLACLLGLSWLSYRWLEQPIQRFVRRMVKRRQRLGAVSEAGAAP